MIAIEEWNSTMMTVRQDFERFEFVENLSRYKRAKVPAGEERFVNKDNGSSCERV